MVSTTATQLASNRRKLRLAQHNRAAVGRVSSSTTSGSSSSGAVAVSNKLNDVAGANIGVGGGILGVSGLSGVVGVGGNNRDLNRDTTGANIIISSSPTPSPTLTTTTSSTAPSSPKSEDGSTTSSLSGAARRRLLRSQNTEQVSNVTSHQHQRSRSMGRIGGNRPQHLLQGGDVDQLQAPGSDSGASGSGGRSNYANVTTSRGRSRRSRAATRRGLGNVRGSGGNISGNNNSNNDNNTTVPGEETRSRHMEEEEDVLSSSAGDPPEGRTAIESSGGAQQIMNQESSNSSPQHIHHNHRRHPQQMMHQQRHGHHKLNLHVAESVDSDDNGTCFNSIGTTTPRQPSPRHSVRHHPGTQGGGTASPRQGSSSDDAPPSSLEEVSPGGEQSTTPSRQQRLLTSKKNARRRNRMNSNNGGTNNNSSSSSSVLLCQSETLSPLQENTTLSPQSRNKGIVVVGGGGGVVVGGGGLLQQPVLLDPHNNKSGTPVRLTPSPSGRMMDGNKQTNSSGGGRHRSIWDHPEEMMPSNNSNKLANAPTATAMGSAANNGMDAPRDAGSTTYSEFDQDGSRAGASSSGWRSNTNNNSSNYYPANNNSYGTRRKRTVPRGGGGGGGGASIESSSRYDHQNDRGYNNDHHHHVSNQHNNSSSIVLEREMMMDNAMGAIGGEPFGAGENAFRSSRGPNNNNAGGSIVSANGGGGGLGGDEDDNILNRPNMKAALGVGAAATLGAVILGPVGLLVGAASVGIGMGFMQIPEEQRTNVRNHAATSLERARDIACDLSDHMSTNCAKYTGTNPHEVVGRVVPEEIMDSCGCANVVGNNSGDGRDGEEDQANYFRGDGVGGDRYHQRGGGGIGGAAGMDDGHSLAGTEGPFGGPAGLEIRSEGSSPIANAVNGVERGVNRLVGDVFGDGDPQHLHHHHSSPASQSMLTTGPGGGGEKGGRGGGVSGGNVGDHHHHGAGGLGAVENEDPGRRVACGRKGRVVPLSQIHSLRPSLQPRAWLDVMASAHTTRDDKNEAMQEILILAKDKEISRWFLEEGILDSLMFILSNYFRNYSSFLRNETQLVLCEEKEEPFSSFKQGGNAFYHAKLAANCCVALGKAHCAAVHTEGDLLLMSAYSRGSVPVERQLAQMLFEVPHHMKVMNSNAAAAGGNGNESQQQQFDVEFTLTELSMQQAEDLASSIKALDDGKIDV